MEARRTALFVDFDNFFGGLLAADPQAALVVAERPSIWLRRLTDAHDDGVSIGNLFTGDAPVAHPRSSVGAGDALLAGFLSVIVADGKQTQNHTTGSQRALHEALAWGAAAVSLPGSRMPGPADLHRDGVRIHNQPDEIRPLLASS